MARDDKKNETVGIVTYPGVALLDLVATKKVLDRLAKGTRYRAVSVGEDTGPMDSNTPLRIMPEKRFEEVPAPVALIVPGGASIRSMPWATRGSWITCALQHTEPR